MNKSAMVLGILFLCGASELAGLGHGMKAGVGGGICAICVGLGEYYRSEEAKAQRELDVVKKQLSSADEPAVEENELNFRGIPGLLQEEEKGLEEQVNKQRRNKFVMYALAVVSGIYSVEEIGRIFIGK